MAHKVSVEVSLGRPQKYVIYYVNSYDPIVKCSGDFSVLWKGIIFRSQMENTLISHLSVLRLK